MKPKLMNRSAEEIGNNHDLLTQLLLRLPTKSLLKFKCVSKQWLSLISDPQFCLSHTRHQHRDDDRFLEPTALLLKVHLAFDTLKSPHYKIIVVREVSVNSYEFEMDIYASETNCWKVSEFNFKADDERMAFEDAVFCNGKLHWNSCGNELLYFDDEKGSFQIMQMPTPSSDHHQLEIHRYFGEINGNLHLAVTYHVYIALGLNVHQMSSDYSHWFLKHRLNLGDAMKVFPELNLGCFPFAPGFSGVSFVGSKKKMRQRL
ncbi:F-box protein At2g40925-like [Hibiscus syriacus]|uniref:F-box protein At2g40925-like n=1 Tax=Hibiscus syriacus TaxID=106335 RepID=UPI001924F4B2|nr:F-box protein At2g40925-like [Hibiscus syriacus]